MVLYQSKGFHHKLSLAQDVSPTIMCESGRQIYFESFVLHGAVRMSDQIIPKIELLPHRMPFWTHVNMKHLIRPPVRVISFCKRRVFGDALPLWYVKMEITQVYKLSDELRIKKLVFQHLNQQIDVGLRLNRGNRGASKMLDPGNQVR